MLKLLEPEDVFKGELAKSGWWEVACISGPIAWPVKTQSVVFRGEAIFVLPVMKGRFPSVALRLGGGMSSEDGQRLLAGFLSALCWVEGRGISIDCVTGGNLPRPMGTRVDHNFLCEEFDLDYLPEPEDEKARLALALYREGLGLNHPAYAFLALYRVLEARFPNGRRRGQWIDANLDTVQGHSAREVLAQLKSEHADVGAHLRDSGRSAIAHATHEPIINPDDPTDTRRLGAELPLMRALAELLIESEFGVESSQTVYRKHLYELAGFKKMLGDELVAQIVRNEPVEDVIDIPAITVELRGREPIALSYPCGRVNWCK